MFTQIRQLFLTLYLKVFKLSFLKINSGNLFRREGQTDEIALCPMFVLQKGILSFDAYPFFAFSDLICPLEDTGMGVVFWLHCAA